MKNGLRLTVNGYRGNLGHDEAEVNYVDYTQDFSWLYTEKERRERHANMVCKFFASDDGCKKGQSCEARHVQKGKGRKVCGSLMHSTRKCLSQEVEKVRNEINLVSVIKCLEEINNNVAERLEQTRNMTMFTTQCKDPATYANYPAC
eukprot:3397815-Amphidinium_carterae.1